MFHKYISNFNIPNFFTELKKILLPFIHGAIIAYILNPAMRFFENNVYNKIKFIKQNNKAIRSFSIATTYIIVMGLIFCLVSYIMPEIIESIKNIISFIKKQDISKIESLVYNKIFENKYIDANSELGIEVKNFITSIINKVLNGIVYFPEMINTIITGTFGIASYILDFILGLVIAFYILLDKERFAIIAKKTLTVFLNDKTKNNIIEFIKLSNYTFERFFVGKIVDSIIIGIIFFIGCLFLKPSYYVLLTIIIGVTNMIPYFGPFIGAVPVVIITFLSSPIKAIWLLIFIFILQQFDGIILGPKILGDSIGLKPIGVIFAIIIGGALFGVLGMFFGVPIFAVISTIYNKYLDEKIILKKQLKERNKYNEHS